MSVRRRTAAFSIGLALAYCGAALAADAPKPAPPTATAQSTPGAPVYREFVLGKPTATVTVIEYASLTCPHCAHFAEDDFPKLKKDYIDTGKVKYIYRDYPLDGLAAAGALIARCAPGDRGFTLIELLFKNQLAWVQSEKPIEPLRMHAKQAGMSDADVDACLKNQGILDTIRDVQSTATNLYKLDATPTFLIGDERVSGADYPKVKELIDKALATKTK